jgi:uncharacterized protein YjbJ (UPF0337 family)
MSSTHDEAEGNMKQVGGKVIRMLFRSLLFKFLCVGQIKETVGHAIGNEQMEAEGKAKNFEGKVEHKVGEVKAAVGK